MKNMILILSVLFFFTGCKEGEIKQQDGLITESATIYYYLDAGFGTSQCDFVIETNEGQLFIPNEPSELPKFTTSNYVNNIKVTYLMTNDKIEKCFHKEGFIKDSTIVIEIISIEKL